MHILITGGTGYIGKHLITYLAKKAIKIDVMVRSMNSDISKIDLYSHNIIVADISKKIEVRPNISYDFVIHLAAANDIDSKDALVALRMTSYGTRNILDWCVSNGIKNILYFSTFQVYGVDQGYVDEKTTVFPKNDYAITHFFAEEYVKLYHRKHNLNYVIIRPANIFGSPYSKMQERWTLVPNCFCKEAVDYNKITLGSSGKQHRDFSSLEEISFYTYAVLKEFSQIKNEIINFASGESITIYKFAELTQKVYKELYGDSCPIDVKDIYPLDEIPLYVSTEKLNRLINTQKLLTSREDEIKKTLQLLKED